MNPFNSLPDYERFIYSLPDEQESVESSTLVIVQRGARVAVVKGELRLAQNHRITVHEQLTMETGVVVIEFYGYEIWHGDVKLYWYDSQPHPNNPDLALNHPHHKHIPPDIKHNRIPAPDMSFEKANLPFLIDEFERNLLRHPT